MAATAQPVTALAAWKALAAHYEQVRGLHLRKLFADDARRGERITVEAAGVYLDYLKNRATDETVKLLLRLAEESGLRARIDAMFRGCREAFEAEPEKYMRHHRQQGMKQR